MLDLATKLSPVTDRLQTAVDAGFRCAEFWLDADWVEKWQHVARTAKLFPMKYELHFPNRGELRDEHLRNCARLFRELNCRVVVVHQPMFDRYADRLLEFDPSIRLAVENHKLNRREFRQWAESSEWLTLDVEHFWKFTLRDAPRQTLMRELTGFVSEYGHKLGHVHLPGYEIGGPEHRPIHHSREMALSVLSLLEEWDFTGLVVSELGLDFQTARELRSDVQLFQHWRERQAVTNAG